MGPGKPPFSLLSLQIWLFLEPHTSGMICVWLVSLSLLPLGFIHDPAQVNNSFFWKTEPYSRVATVSDAAAMNTPVPVGDSALGSLGSIPQVILLADVNSCIKGWRDKLLLIFLLPAPAMKITDCLWPVEINLMEPVATETSTRNHSKCRYSQLILCSVSFGHDHRHPLTWHECSNFWTRNLISTWMYE